MKKFIDDLKRKTDSVKKDIRDAEGSNKGTFHACKHENSTECLSFTRYLASTQSDLAAHSLFITRALNFVKKDINDKEIKPVLIQPHFIGQYAASDNVKNCNLEEDEITFNDVAYDMNSVNDKKAFLRIKQIANLMGRHSVSDHYLRKCVVFDKKIFKYALLTENIKSKKVLQKHSTSYSFEQLKSQFKGLVNLQMYFERLFRIKHQDMTAGAANSLLGGMESIVVCKSYFHALKQAVESTPIQIVLDYIEFSALLTAHRKFPQVFTKEDRIALGLTRQIDCNALTEVAFPYAIAKMNFNFHHLDGKEKTIHRLIADIKKSLIERIDQHEWMSDADKIRAKSKIVKIKSIVGLPLRDLNTTHLNMRYKNVHIKGTFLETLMNVKKNNLHQIYMSLFAGHEEINLPTQLLPDEANASYDLRKNRVTVNMGALALLLRSKKITDVRLFAEIGFVVSHELLHSIGPSGRRFNADGTYTKGGEDDETMRAYTDRREEMKGKVNKICTKTFTYTDGTSEKIRPDYNLFEEEISADLGGVSVAFNALKTRIGADKITNSQKQEFFEIISRFLCKTESLEELKASIAEHERHPPDYCRLNVISHTKQFNEAFQCPNDRLTLTVW